MFNVGFKEAGIEIVHHFCGGVYVKETRIPAGLKLIQHRHSFDHLSILVSGTVRIHNGEAEETLIGYCAVNIKADTVHEVTALSDVVWLCVHATNETDPEKIDHELVQ